MKLNLQAFEELRLQFESKHMTLGSYQRQITNLRDDKVHCFNFTISQFQAFQE